MHRLNFFPELVYLFIYIHSAELDALYVQRREKIAAFRQAQSDFHLRTLEAKEQANAKRDEERRKAREERILEKEGRQKEQ